MGIFRWFSRRCAPAIVSLCAWALISACGGGAQGPAKGADDAGETTGTSASDAPANADEATSTEAGPTGPDCSDQTCFACGESMCPVGFYCDEKASGGPACSWLPECAAKASCACVTGVLGSSCSCDEASGGPHVACE